MAVPASEPRAVMRPEAAPERPGASGLPAERALRTADQFMERLGRRELEPKPAEADRDTAPTMERRDTTPRLEPPVPPEIPLREPEPPAPSLSIGRLLVEVVNPPASPPPPAPAPRVIVHEGASGRGRIPSAGRFGLGQV